VLAAIPGRHIGHYTLTDDARAVAWLAQIASALGTLHELGITHGSVRPSAIRITPDGRAVLVEVGLHPGGSEEQDWRRLANVFRDIGPPLRGPLDSVMKGERSGTSLLAALLSSRDPTAAGGPRYRSGPVLGQGGMGEVREVFDPVLQRRVAQKVLGKNLIAHADCIDRFVEEARITAQLQHPGIVPVHDLEHLPNGAIAFTMKPIEGRTLTEVIRDVHSVSADRWRTSDSSWSLRRLIEALRRTCDAMAYAHDHGVLHLDLKPANIMVGDFGEVLVVDWGLARRLDSEGVAHVDRVFGTVGYMPPEQNEPGEHHLTPKTDIYALGACLIEILDGGPPAPDYRTTAYQSTRSDAPKELISVARRATTTSPDDRFASVQSLAADLGAWLAQQPVQSHNYTSLEVVQRRLRPHQGPLLVGTIAVVVLVAVGSVAWLRLEVARDQANIMLSQTLLDRAHLALEANDTVRAETYAAEAVKVSRRPEGRGLLARLGRGWRPELKQQWQRECLELTVTDNPTVIVCTSTTSVASLPSDANPGWSRAGVIRGLTADRAGGWFGIIHDTLVKGDAKDGTIVSSLHHNEPIHTAAAVGGRTVLGAQSHLTVLSSSNEPLEVLSLTSPATVVVRCGSDHAVIATESGHLLRLHVDDGATLHDLQANRINAPMQCSPSGRSLAVASDRSVQVWSIDPDEQVYDLTGHLGRVESLAWSPDGQTLATGSSDGLVRVWDATKGTELGRLPGHHGVKAMAFTPDGNGLVTATKRQVRYWALPSDPPARDFNAVVEVVKLAWASDGDLFTLDRLGRPQAFDTNTGLSAGSIYLNVTDLSPDPLTPRVAITSESGAFGVLDLEQNRFVHQAKDAHPGGGTSVAWRPTGQHVTSAGMAGDVVTWAIDPSNGAVQRLWSVGLGHEVHDLAWSADGRRLSARTVQSVVLLQHDTGEQRAVFPGEVHAHAIGPEGNAVLLGWSRGGASLGHAPANGTGSWQFDSIELDGHVVGASFSSTETLLATVTREGLIQVFDTTDATELARLFAHPSGASDLSFAPNGDMLVSAGTQGDILMLDSALFRADPAVLQTSIARRYGVRRTGTELEFR
ncbi:MAG: serine/threonine protein kinase/WD40 repeat protein, partial [Kiritimatiellia bacterium]